MNQTKALPPADRVLSVWDLTAQISSSLRTCFPDVWVSGEISNHARSGAGHSYLTLKDDRAQLRAVMWRSVVVATPFEIGDGMEVIARGAIEVYAGRGQYQLMIREILPKGMGALELALRQLRDKLEKEGLFDKERKRPLPRFARCVAVVTSARGAAVRDFLEVAGRRWSGANIVICPCNVQGDCAVEEIMRAIQSANRLADVDAIALVRGGGSLEDLAAFNTEAIARAIAGSRIPIITGVGHEIDVTIADLVADVRALTPSEAAERIFPDRAALMLQLSQWTDRLAHMALARYEREREGWNRLSQSRAFQFPLDMLSESVRRLDELEKHLLRSTQQRLERASAELAIHAKTLDSLSPLNVLGRGYAIALRHGTHEVIDSINKVELGEDVDVDLADGRLTCRVDSRSTRNGR